MVTKFKVTNGPSQLDLMLALFDPEPLGQTRTVTFTLQGVDYRIAGIDHRSPEQRLEVELYDQNVGPADYEIVVHAVERDILTGTLKIVGCYIESHDLVTVEHYSTKKRSGTASIQYSGYGSDIDEDNDLNPHMCHNWTCDWCKKSFSDSVQPCQTFDGGTICSECFEYDDEGPQIARYGITQYEAENEPKRVVYVDGKVYYE